MQLARDKASGVALDCSILVIVVVDVVIVIRIVLSLFLSLCFRLFFFFFFFFVMFLLLSPLKLVIGADVVATAVTGYHNWLP